ncbi:hypothetical protein ACFL6U_15735 [Planctomycetota bacterium]
MAHRALIAAFTPYKPLFSPLVGISWHAIIVTIIAFIPGDVTESWTSQMKVIGRLAGDRHNYLGVAYAKASEMATTFQDRGTTDRKALTGELGY